MFIIKNNYKLLFVVALGLFAPEVKPSSLLDPTATAPLRVFYGAENGYIAGKLLFESINSRTPASDLAGAALCGYLSLLEFSKVFPDFDPTILVASAGVLGFGVNYYQYRRSLPEQFKIKHLFVLKTLEDFNSSIESLKNSLELSTTISEDTKTALDNWIESIQRKKNHIMTVLEPMSLGETPHVGDLKECMMVMNDFNKDLVRLIERVQGHVQDKKDNCVVALSDVSNTFSLVARDFVTMLKWFHESFGFVRTLCPFPTKKEAIDQKVLRHRIQLLPEFESAQKSQGGSSLVVQDGLCFECEQPLQQGLKLQLTPCDCCDKVTLLHKACCQAALVTGSVPSRCPECHEGMVTLPSIQPSTKQVKLEIIKNQLRGLFPLLGVQAISQGMNALFLSDCGRRKFAEEGKPRLKKLTEMAGFLAGTALCTAGYNQLTQTVLGELNSDLKQLTATFVPPLAGLATAYYARKSYQATNYNLANVALKTSIKLIEE